MQNLETGRSQGFKHYCEKITSNGSKSFNSGSELVQLPSGWKELTKESTTTKDGVTTYTKTWYQLTEESEIECY